MGFLVPLTYWRRTTTQSSKAYRRFDKWGKPILKTPPVMGTAAVFVNIPEALYIAQVGVPLWLPELPVAYPPIGGSCGPQ